MTGKLKLYPVIAILLLINGSIAFAQNSHDERLPWVNGKFPPKKGNYEYVKSHGSGKTLREASSTAFDNFLFNLGSLEKMTLDPAKIKRELHQNIEADNHSTIYNESTTQAAVFNITTGEVSVSCFKVDEYYEKADGEYHLWELYEISKPGQSFKSFIPEYTDRYGFSAAWKSMLLPGWGQFAKGQTGKGFLFLASEAALVSGTIYFESMRANNFRKSQETTNLALIKEYRNRADNWALYRNIGIGAAAGVYLWNVLDAALAKGKIRYVSENVHFNTTQIDGMAYLGLAINF